MARNVVAGTELKRDQRKGGGELLKLFTKKVVSQERGYLGDMECNVRGKGSVGGRKRETQP